MDNEKCLEDLVFRKNTRAMYPGACAHEFTSIM